MFNSVGGPHREACQPGGLAGTVGTSSGRLTNFFGVAEESWSSKVGQKSWSADSTQKGGSAAVFFGMASLRRLLAAV